MLRMLDFICGSCHKKFEVLADAETHACLFCGNEAHRDHSTDYHCAFGGFSDRGVTVSDIATYKEHNQTFHYIAPPGTSGGVIEAKPLSHAGQCQCDKCNGVKKRFPRSTADIGKDATL